MAQLNLGKVKFVWRGDYSAVTVYQRDDVVAYLGSSWVCKTANTVNVAPAEPSANWGVMARGIVATAYTQALLTAPDAPSARTVLGLGTAATANLGVAAGNAFPTDSTTTYSRTLIAAATAAEARTALGLGTAATATMTTSNADTTAGRVLKVGDFALGVAADTLALPNPANTDAATDFNTIQNPGWYYRLLGGAAGSRNANHPDGQTAANSGSNVSNFYWLLVAKFGTNLIQVAFPYASATDTTVVTIKFRVLGGGVWSAWRTMFHDGVFAVSAFAKTLLDDADATAARTTLGIGDKQVCNAWVNFNGTGSVTIRDSYNVNTVTDNGTGDYTVNFITPMNNANYQVATSVGPTNGSTPNGVVVGAGPALATDVPPTTSGFRILTVHAGATLVDIARVGLNVFGGK